MWGHGTVGLVSSRGAQTLALADAKGHHPAKQRPEGDEERDVQPQAVEAEHLVVAAHPRGAHEVDSAPRMHVSHLVGYGGHDVAGLRYGHDPLALLRPTREHRPRGGLLVCEDLLDL